MQRVAQQLRIIREALKLYLNHLREDDINLELKNCLTAEARKVADLLDNCVDSSKLCIIVSQVSGILIFTNKNSLLPRKSNFEDILRRLAKITGKFLQKWEGRTENFGEF